MMTLGLRAHDFPEGAQRRFPALWCHDLSEWLLRTASLGEFAGMTVSMQRLPANAFNRSATPSPPWQANK